MSVTYEKRQRDTAKERQVPLVTIDFDDRHMKKGCGRYAYQGFGNTEGLACALRNLRAYLEVSAPDSPALKELSKGG